MLFELQSIMSLGLGLRQGQWQQKMAEYQAGVYRAQQAKLIQEGRIKAAEVRRQGAIAVSQKTVQYASSGVRLAGSPREVLDDSRTQTDYQAKVIEAGYQFESDLMGRQSLIASAEGAYGMQQATTGAWISLLKDVQTITAKYAGKGAA
jgi:hypothetical protein